MPTAELSVLLKNARKRAGMTQRQLADLSTVSVRTIRDLELERTKAPRNDTMRLLADALRLSELRRAELERAATVPFATESLIDELPVPQTPLRPIFGREHEVASLIDMLKSGGHRLITIVGMPGIGKTRLIQEVASRIHQSGQMPVICVERQHKAPAVGQAPLSSRDALIHGIADPLRCRPVLDDVVTILDNRLVLITVQGHDLDQDADLALRLLLRRCPGVRVLYEKRDRSSPSGNPVFTVFPLAVPEWGYGEQPVADLTEYSSVQFMRAHCAQSHAESPSDPIVLNAIAGICWCLDGNPAALESAASWLLLYNASQLLREAGRHPLLLTRSPANVGHSVTGWLKQTVHSLSDEDDQLLRRLVEFEPWTVEQAVDSVGGPTDSVSLGIYRLRAHGLLRRTDPLNREQPRFTVLNLVRHFIKHSSS